MFTPCSFLRYCVGCRRWLSRSVSIFLETGEAIMRSWHISPRPRCLQSDTWIFNSLRGYHFLWYSGLYLSCQSFRPFPYPTCSPNRWKDPYPWICSSIISASQIIGTMTSHESTHDAFIAASLGGWTTMDLHCHYTNLHHLSFPRPVYVGALLISHSPLAVAMLP